MKNDKRSRTVLDEARRILRPGNAEFAEEASLQAGLDAFRARRQPCRALRWGLPAAAAALLVLATVFYTLSTIEPERPVAEENGTAAELDPVIVNTRMATSDRVVRTRTGGTVIHTTSPGAARTVVVRTTERTPHWEPIDDIELLALFGDRPVGLVALADGSKQLVLPGDADPALMPEP